MSTQALYPALVWELFSKAPQSGRPSTQTGWCRGEGSEPLSATRVRVYLLVFEDRVQDVRYEVRGCPFTVAAAALVATRWIGQPVSELVVRPRGLLDELSAPVTKLGRMLVVEDAYRRALQAAAQTA